MHVNTNITALLKVELGNQNDQLSISTYHVGSRCASIVPEPV